MFIMLLTENYSFTNNKIPEGIFINFLPAKCFLFI